jgi:hypothetical protein
VVVERSPPDLYLACPGFKAGTGPWLKILRGFPSALQENDGRDTRV